MMSDDIYEVKSVLNKTTGKTGRVIYLNTKDKAVAFNLDCFVSVHDDLMECGTFLELKDSTQPIHIEYTASEVIEVMKLGDT